LLALGLLGAGAAFRRHWNWENGFLWEEKGFLWETPFLNFWQIALIMELVGLQLV
jgi:hypothetical protein